MEIQLDFFCVDVLLVTPCSFFLSLELLGLVTP